MAAVSYHARDRVHQRISRTVVPQEVLDTLWAKGRVATTQDFTEFDTVKLPGRQYRVAMHQRRIYLIACDAQTGTYITIILKG